MVTAFEAPPIDGLGTTGGFKLIVEDGGNLGLDQLQLVNDNIAAAGNETKELHKRHEDRHGEDRAELDGSCRWQRSRGPLPGC